jgi:hypothetical protein
METVGLGLYFEDLPVGRQFKTIGRTHRDDIPLPSCCAHGRGENTNEFLAHERHDTQARRRARWSTVSPGAVSK